jgi:hypothetical protein
MFAQEGSELLRRRLADYILENIEPILAEWEKFARTIQPATSKMDQKELRNDAEALLREVAKDMKGAQSRTSSRRNRRADACLSIKSATMALPGSLAENAFERGCPRAPLPVQLSARSCTCGSNITSGPAGSPPSSSVFIRSRSPAHRRILMRRRFRLLLWSNGAIPRKRIDSFANCSMLRRRTAAKRLTRDSL